MALQQNIRFFKKDSESYLTYSATRSLLDHGRGATVANKLGSLFTSQKTSPGSGNILVFHYAVDWGEVGEVNETLATMLDNDPRIILSAFITPFHHDWNDPDFSHISWATSIDCDVIDYTDDSGSPRQKLSFVMPDSVSRPSSNSVPNEDDAMGPFEPNGFMLVFDAGVASTLGGNFFTDLYYQRTGNDFSEYSGTFYKQNNLNSLRFRCYESIYNAFYRDARNNPLIDPQTKKPVYNRYLLNDGDGLDQFDYKLHVRNWEFDQFTSCVPQPQQGTAPLVGISAFGDVTFQSSEDGKTYTFSTETASDAETITKINVTSNVPNDVARSIMNSVSQGISINDFRNVNAMQKWLETNIRRGMKIKDQIKARWGIDIKESLLDMPEFIGGFSIDIDINQISQTSETDVAPLGAYAGQATGFGGSKHDVSCYCDQHGYIMAIVSVVPEPLYDQLIEKDFYKSSPLDYYNPEFGQIGFQPVYKKEIVPLTTGSHNGLFGYQRPWYDYLIKNNELHGLFRSNLRNFVLARNFDDDVELNEQFTTIHHDSLNNIFSVDNSDKILGMIRFNVTAARPIPSTSIPSLG